MFASRHHKEPLCGFFDLVEVNGPGAFHLGCTNANDSECLSDRKTLPSCDDDDRCTDKLWFEVKDSKLNCFSSIADLRTGVAPLDTFELRKAKIQIEEEMLLFNFKDMKLCLRAPSVVVAENWYAGLTKLLRQRRSSKTQRSSQLQQ